MKIWITQNKSKLLFLQLVTICIIGRSMSTSEVCTEEGSIRTDISNAYYTSWLHVCEDKWEMSSLDEYCRQAGYRGGSELSGKRNSNGTVSGEEMNENSSRLMLCNCTGDENATLKCKYKVEYGDCLDVGVNKSECRKCQTDGSCNGRYCVDVRCVCSTNYTSGVYTQIKCEYKTEICALLILGVVIPTVSVLIGAAVIVIRHRKIKRKKSRDTSTTDIQLHILTVKDYGIEGNITYIASDSEEIFTNYWSITDRTVIENTTEEIGQYLEPNAVLYRNRHSSVESELYGVLVEGEVADYEKYDRLSQTNTEVYEELAKKYQNVFPSHETPIDAKRSSNRNTFVYIEPPTSLPYLENVFEKCFNEINRGEIEMGNEFASGQFGVVYRAVYHTQGGDIPVAIKTLKETSDTDTKVAFMREAAILAQFQHPNVLRLIGVLTAQQPYMMVTELLKTELAELLLKFRVLLTATNSSSNSGTNLTAQKLNLPNLLLRFAQEISAGMEHLSEKHFIHRDLAARNVLVAKDLSCRIADFGMSRELISDSEYYTSSGGRIPLRWTAPEAVFYQKYSEKSDVWSFGMTLFEIWSLGEKPWGKGATNDDIIAGLSEGRKLSPPTGCPRDVYSVMVETWRMDPSTRPTFSSILHLLTNIHLSVALPISPETDPSLCLGNDPMLSRDHYPDLQKVN